MKTKKALSLLVGALAIVGLSACVADDPATSVDSGGGVSSESVRATRISYDRLPYLLVEETLDLDEYVRVVYSDRSEDTDFTVTCADEAVLIKGHTVTSQEMGDYQLIVGDSKGVLNPYRITLSVKSQQQINAIEFLEPLSDTPQNYTTEIWSNGYIWTCTHTPNYFAMYDKNDPDKTYTDDDGEVYQNSNVLAMLGDNNAYWGAFYPSDNEYGYDVKYDPGKVTATFNYYYVMMGLELDATAFEYQEYHGETVLMSDYNFAYTLSLYGCGQNPEYNGLTIDGAIFNGTLDTDLDDTPDVASFSVMVSEGNSYGEYMEVRLSNIGTTSNPVLENSITVANAEAYVPVPVDTSDIVTAFGKLDAAGSYTTVTEMYSSDEDGEAITPSRDSSSGYDDGMVTITEYSYLRYESKVTPNGFLVMAYGKHVSISSTGVYTIPETEAFIGGTAIFERDDKVCVSTGEPNAEGTAINWTTTVSTSASATSAHALMVANGITAAAVTSAGAASSNLSSRTVSETDPNVITFEGAVGDNDNEEATNTLFQQIFDMNGYNNFGTYFTRAREGTSGYFSVGTSSDYENITVNISTGAIDIDVMGYLPFSDVGNNYMAIKFDTKDIGATTIDFSGYPDPTTTGGGDSSSSASGRINASLMDGVAARSL